MAKLPDGMVTIFRPYKTEIRIIQEELIFCKNCEHFQHETDMCTMWGAYTEIEGYCFKADQKEEDIVALDFSEDIDRPSRYQTSDGEWHEGMTGGD